jgi:hypothetical protein
VVCLGIWGGGSLEKRDRAHTRFRDRAKGEHPSLKRRLLKTPVACHVEAHIEQEGSVFVPQRWDTAAKGGPDNDWSVCSTFLLINSQWHLVNVWCGRVDYNRPRTTLCRFDSGRGKLSGRRLATPMLSAFVEGTSGKVKRRVGVTQ